MRRYRRMRLLAAASGLVVNAIVFHGRATWFAVPDADRTARLWFEHYLADGLAHEFCDVPPGTRGYLAKRSKLFLSQVNLSFFHGCQSMTDDDVRQNELPCGKLRGIERPNRKTSRGKPRGIEPDEIQAGAAHQ